MKQIVFETKWWSNARGNFVKKKTKNMHASEKTKCKIMSQTNEKGGYFNSTCSHYARQYMSNGMIHAQRSFSEIARALSSDWLKVDFWISQKVQWQQIHRTVEQFSTNQALGDILYPRFWLVENFSSMQCICFHWTLYPKINFQPIRTCLTHAQWPLDMYHSVGHVSPCIVCCWISGAFLSGSLLCWWQTLLSPWQVMWPGFWNL